MKKSLPLRQELYQGVKDEKIGRQEWRCDPQAGIWGFVSFYRFIDILGD